MQNFQNFGSCAPPTVTITHLFAPIMIDSTEIKRPKLYRLSYLHEGMGCIMRKYSTSRLLLKEALTELQTSEEHTKQPYPPIAKFWILQENISNTKKEFWNDIWSTIERTPEIDLLFEPEPKTELERNLMYRREL